MASVLDRKVSFSAEFHESSTDSLKEELLEDLKDEMQIALLSALQDAATACAKICVDRITKIEKAFAIAPESGAASRRTSFYEIISRRSTQPDMEAVESMKNRNSTINLLDENGNTPNNATLDDMYEFNLADPALDSKPLVPLESTVESFAIGGDDTLETPPSKEESAQPSTPAKTDDVASSLAARKAANASNRQSRVSTGTTGSAVSQKSRAPSRISAAFKEGTSYEPVETAPQKLADRGPFEIDTKESTEENVEDTSTADKTTSEQAPEGGLQSSSAEETKVETGEIAATDRRPSLGSREMAPRRSVASVSEKGLEGTFSATEIADQEEINDAIDDEFKNVMEKWDSRKRGATLDSTSAVEEAQGTPFDRKPSWEELPKTETTPSPGVATDSVEPSEPENSISAEAAEETSSIAAPCSNSLLVSDQLSENKQPESVSIVQPSESKELLEEPVAAPDVEVSEHKDLGETGVTPIVQPSADKDLVEEPSVPPSAEASEHKDSLEEPSVTTTQQPGEDKDLLLEEPAPVVAMPYGQVPATQAVIDGVEATKHEDIAQLDVSDHSEMKPVVASEASPKQADVAPSVAEAKEPIQLDEVVQPKVVYPEVVGQPEDSEVHPKVVSPYVSTVLSETPDSKEKTIEASSAEEVKSIGEYLASFSSATPEDLSALCNALNADARNKLLDSLAACDDKVKSLGEFAESLKDASSIQLATLCESLSEDARQMLIGSLATLEGKAESADATTKEQTSSSGDQGSREEPALDEDKKLAQQAAANAVAKATEVAMASHTLASSEAEPPTPTVVEPSEVGVAAQVSMEPRESLTGLKLKLHEALQTSADNGTLQTFLENNASKSNQSAAPVDAKETSSANELQSATAEIEIMEAQAETSTHDAPQSVLVSKDLVSDLQKAPLDEAESAPVVVAPYLDAPQSVPVSKDSVSDLQKAPLDEEESGPVVVAPYLDVAKSPPRQEEEPSSKLEVDNDEPLLEVPEVGDFTSEPQPQIVVPYLDVPIAPPLDTDAENSGTERIGDIVEGALTEKKEELASQGLAQDESKTVVDMDALDELEEKKKEEVFNAADDALARYEAELAKTEAAQMSIHVHEAETNTTEAAQEISPEAEKKPEEDVPKGVDDEVEERIPCGEAETNKMEAAQEISPEAEKIETQEKKPEEDVPKRVDDEDEKKNEEERLPSEKDMLQTEEKTAADERALRPAVEEEPRKAEDERIPKEEASVEVDLLDDPAFATTSEPASNVTESSSTQAVVESSVSAEAPEKEKRRTIQFAEEDVLCPIPARGQTDSDMSSKSPISVPAVVDCTEITQPEVVEAVPSTSQPPALVEEKDAETVQSVDAPVPEFSVDAIEKLEPAAEETAEAARPPAPASLGVAGTSQEAPSPNSLQASMEPAALETKSLEVDNAGKLDSALEAVQTPAPVSLDVAEKSEVAPLPTLVQTSMEPTALETKSPEDTAQRSEPAPETVQTPAPASLDATEKNEVAPSLGLEQTSMELQASETKSHIDTAEKVEPAPEAIKHPAPASLETSEAALSPTNVQTSQEAPALETKPPVDTAGQLEPVPEAVQPPAPAALDVTETREEAPSATQVPAVEAKALVESTEKLEAAPEAVQLSAQAPIDIAQTSGQSSPPAEILPAAHSPGEGGVGTASSHEEATQVRKIYASSDVKSLGFTLAGLPPDVVTVKTVTPGSWAEEQGLVRAARIVRVNGEVASSLTTEQVKGCLRQRPIEMEVLPPEVEGTQAARQSIDVESNDMRVSRASTIP